MSNRRSVDDQKLENKKKPIVERDPYKELENLQKESSKTESWFGIGLMVVWGCMLVGAINVLGTGFFGIVISAGISIFFFFLLLNISSAAKKRNDLEKSNLDKKFEEMERKEEVEFDNSIRKIVDQVKGTQSFLFRVLKENFNLSEAEIDKKNLTFYSFALVLAGLKIGSGRTESTLYSASEKKVIELMIRSIPLSYDDFGLIQKEMKVFFERADFIFIKYWTDQNSSYFKSQLGILLYGSCALVKAEEDSLMVDMVSNVIANILFDQIDFYKTQLA